MKIFHLILKEIVHRKMNFLFSLLAIVTAVALFVSFFTTGEASKRETTRLMRDIGLNLRIIPKDTDMEKFWVMRFSEFTMPEDYVDKLASQQDIAYAHLTATLLKRVFWRGREIILTGIAPEVSPPGKKKPPMSFTIKRGTVYVGYELARKLGLSRGEVIDIFGTSFTIERCLSESGSEDDIRIYGHLHDIQNILDLKNRINEIQALQCLCLLEGTNTNSLAVLREQLAKTLPNTQVILIQSIAAAREKQRIMAEKYFSFIMPFALIVCIAWIGILAMMNVRERQQEIGIMRALGYRSSQIAFLFLGKAITMGLIGAAIGFGIGSGLALQFGPDIFKVTAKMIEPSIELLYWSLLAAPLFSSLAMFIPTIVAVTQDPAVVLMEE